MLWRAEPWPCSSPLRSPDPLQYFELCFVVRESTGWAAEQTDRRLPGFPLQAAGASVRSFKFCLCIKEEQNNNRLTWLLVDFMSPPQNDIQNSMEWGCALHYPQLARLQGNLNVDLWEKRPLRHNIHCYCLFFFSLTWVKNCSHSSQNSSSARVLSSQSLWSLQKWCWQSSPNMSVM